MTFSAIKWVLGVLASLVPASLANASSISSDVVQFTGDARTELDFSNIESAAIQLNAQGCELLNYNLAKDDEKVVMDFKCFDRHTLVVPPGIVQMASWNNCEIDN